MHLEHPHTDSREYGPIWGTATGQPSTCRFVYRLPHTLLRHAPTPPQMLTPLNPQITPRYSATSPLPSYVGRMGRHCSVLCVHAQHSHRPDGSIDTNLSPKWTRSSTPPSGPRDWMSRIVLTSHIHTTHSLLVFVCRDILPVNMLFTTAVVDERCLVPGTFPSSTWSDEFLGFPPSPRWGNNSLRPRHRDGGTTF